MDLQVGGTSKISVNNSGNTIVGGTLRSTGNFDVATNKFTVAASSGNTAIAGTLGVSDVTTITPATITSAGTDDKVLNLTQTLNDSSAAEGTQKFRFIRMVKSR